MNWLGRPAAEGLIATYLGHISQVEGCVLFVVFQRSVCPRSHQQSCLSLETKPSSHMKRAVAVICLDVNIAARLWRNRSNQYRFAINLCNSCHSLVNIFVGQLTVRTLRTQLWNHEMLHFATTAYEFRKVTWISLFKCSLLISVRTIIFIQTFSPFA